MNENQLLTISLTNDIDIQINEKGVLIGPIINRDTKSINYYTPILQLKNYNPENLVNDDHISLYMSMKKSRDITLDYLTLCRDFDILNLLVNDEKSRCMTEDEIMNDLDFINEKLVSVRKMINDDTVDKSVRLMLELQLNVSPHQIFNMQSSESYYNYLNYIESLLQDEEEEKTEEIKKNIDNFDWS